MDERDETADDEQTGAWVRAAQRGDTIAQEALLRQHLEGLRAFVRLHADRALRLRESESDLVQSVCREALCDLGGFEYRGAAGFRGWLYTLARNKVREKGRFHAAERRAARREAASLDQGELALPAYSTFFSPSECAQGVEARERFEAAFDRLTDEQREVISLARILRLPHKEIAARVGKSEVAVRSLLSRALVALSSELVRPAD